MSGVGICIIVQCKSQSLKWAIDSLELATIYEELGKLELAEEWFEKALNHENNAITFAEWEAIHNSMAVGEDHAADRDNEALS